MKFRYRVLISFALLLTSQFLIFIYWTIENQKPEYFKILEESMSETSAIIAKFLETEVKNGEVDIAKMPEISRQLDSMNLDAKIYEKEKKKIEVGVYVFNKKGIVLFDSLQPEYVGQDFSKWNDVLNCLAGKYGVRTTLEDNEDDDTSILYVAMPIKSGDEIVGGVTVYKHAKSILPFFNRFQKNISLFGLMSLILLLVFSVFILIWIFLPLSKLVQYARNIKLSEDLSASNEIEQIHGKMRKVITDLESKQHIETCLQTLTHEIKTPVSVIQGAAELLMNDLPSEQRVKLLNNIHQENERIKKLLTNYLTLASLDAQKHVEEKSKFYLLPILQKIQESYRISDQNSNVEIILDCDEGVCYYGYPFLFYMLINNLVSNAIDFSHSNDKVFIKCYLLPDGGLCVEVIDSGEGLPDFALERIFEKFYSLKRPNNKKSTGLGLSIVAEIIKLHNGQIKIENRGSSSGAIATVKLPRVSMADKES